MLPAVDSLRGHEQHYVFMVSIQITRKSEKSEQKLKPIKIYDLTLTLNSVKS